MSPSSVPAHSLDDEDTPVSTPVLASLSLSSFSSSSSSPVSQDPLAVKLCKSLLRLPEQLKQLESGRYADENEGSDVFEVNIDTWRGSVAVRQLRDIPQGLETATQEARERVADQIEKFMEDIAALEQECAVLTKKMRESEGEGCEALASHYAALQAVIGQREKELSALKRKSAVEVEVEVERMSTRVEVVNEEIVELEKEKRLVPLVDPGVYVFGGLSGPDGVDSLTVERYDPAEDSWKEVLAMTSLRTNHASAVFGDAIYAIGGKSGLRCFDSVERFSASSGKWESVAPMPRRKHSCVAGVLNGNIYVAGGWDGKRFVSSVARFDVRANQWQDVAPMSCARAYAGGAILGGLFYVFGGIDSAYGTEWRVHRHTVERYDPVRNDWELMAAMKHVRFGCAAAVLNGCIYAIGGYGHLGRTLSSVERFDPKANKWEDVAPLLDSRAYGCAAVLDGRLYVMGGMRDENTSFGSERLSHVERYNASRDCWERVADMTSERSFAAAAVAS